MIPGSLQFLSAATISKRLGDLLKDLERLLLLPQHSATDIHDLRRSIKKLRAWIRLWRGEGKLKGSARTDHLLRASAAEFAAARDARVRVDTLKGLSRFGDNPAADQQTCLQLLHASTTASLPAPDPTLLQKTAKRLAAMTPSAALADNPRKLRQGLRATYRKARKLLHIAMASGRPEDLHRFRRWVKYLLYQTGLVALRNSGQARLLHQQLDMLGSLLGDHHDILVLQQTLDGLLAVLGEHAQSGELEARQGEGAEPRAALARASALCTMGLQRVLQQALPLAQACFSRAPADFAGDIAA